MRVAERELLEIEKKRVAIESLSSGDGPRGRASAGSAGADASKDRVAELKAQIEEEARRLCVVRAEMLKMKSSGTAASGLIQALTSTAAGGKESAGQTVGEAKSSAGSETAAGKEAEKGNAVSEKDRRPVGNPRGVPMRLVPDELIPDLCRCVIITPYPPH